MLRVALDTVHVHQLNAHAWNSVSVLLRAPAWAFDVVAPSSLYATQPLCADLVCLRDVGLAARMVRHGTDNADGDDDCEVGVNVDRRLVFANVGGSRARADLLFS